MFVRTTAINKILKLTKRVKAIQGGTSAGKTFGIIPVIIDKAIKTPGLECSIVSESLPHLKKGAIKDFKKIMKQTKRWDSRKWHITNKTYTFFNGSYIEFFGADDSSKQKGPRRDLLYMNEANNMAFETYRELSKRTKQDIYLDWNPTNPFWFHDEIQNDYNVEFIILTYKDNEGCPQSAIDDIILGKSKAFFNTELPDDKIFTPDNIKNPFWANDYRVYGLGLTGQLQGAIFTDWIRGEFDESLSYCYGMDFGFNPSPTTLIRVAVDIRKKKLYLKEEFYRTELSTNDIAGITKSRIKYKMDLIIADGIELREINELRACNLNVHPAEKGPGSIKAGIKSMQSYQIIVCGESENLENELNHYIWNDKKAGIPQKAFDHLIDPARYAFDTLAMR